MGTTYSCNCIMGTSSNEFLIFGVCVWGGYHPAFNAGFPTSLSILIALICVVSVCLSVDNERANLIGSRHLFSLMFAETSINF